MLLLMDNHTHRVTKRESEREREGEREWGKREQEAQRSAVVPNAKALFSHSPFHGGSSHSMVAVKGKQKWGWEVGICVDLRPK